MQTLNLDIGDDKCDININTYTLLCDNFIFTKKEEAERYKKEGHITFNQLRNLCRKNKFSYPLFFADVKRVQDMVQKHNEYLYGKIDEGRILTIGSRGKIEDIRAMRWIISDISEKQKIYKKYGNDRNLQQEKIVKFLKNSSESIREQAEYICNKIQLSREELVACNTKLKAFDYITSKLTATQIHVFREVKNAMPQNIPSDMEFSGLYLRDNYNPVIFIGNELSLYPDEGIGRKIYTVVFLLVAIFKGYSFAIKIDPERSSIDRENYNKLSDIYKITNEILMPEEYIKLITVSDINSIKTEASMLKVSPTALVVRLADVGILNRDIANNMKDCLRREYLEYIQKKRAEEKKKREQGIATGPSLKKIYKSYHGDFIEFVRNNVPLSERRSIFNSRISYGRNYAMYEDLYG